MSKKTNDIALLAGNEDTVDVTEQIKAMDDLDKEIEALEAVVAADKDEMTPEARKLAEFKLTPNALQLLDAALDNVSSNDGRGIEDKQAAAQVSERAALIGVCGHDLSNVIAFICDAVPEKEATQVIYSTCFAVQKAANFIANLKYRRALDPRADEDLTPFVDRREDDTQRDPPCGLGPDGETPTVYGNAVEHPDVWIEPQDEVRYALMELHDYLQLLTEAFGWDAERPMPYLFIQEKDETFKPVTDPETCLDIMEVRRKQSRARRQERQTANLHAALSAARKALVGAGKRAA